MRPDIDVDWDNIKVDGLDVAFGLDFDLAPGVEPCECPEIVRGSGWVWSAVASGAVSSRFPDELGSA